MPRLIAALDADVLVPILSCDLLLTAFNSRLYEPVVSTQVLAEVERNLIDDFPRLAPAGAHRRRRHRLHGLGNFQDLERLVISEVAR